MTPVKIDKSVINRMEIRELKDEIARLQQERSDNWIWKARYESASDENGENEDQLERVRGIVQQISNVCDFWAAGVPEWDGDATMKHVTGLVDKILEGLGGENDDE